jgi:hypothetical protein
MIDESLAATLCWVLFAASFVLTVFIYRADRRVYGGVGMATLLAAMAVLYNLLNPFFYLISPLLALNYALMIGLNEPPSVLLPNVASSAIFLFCLWFYGLYLPRISRKIVLATPIARSNVEKLLRVMWLLIGVGLILYIGRNLVAFGSWAGSFSAAYTGDTARPQVPVLSNFVQLWLWGNQIALIICLWQVKAKRIRPYWVALPVCVGFLFAVIEGDRALLGATTLIFVGWFSLRSTITLKKIGYGFLGLTMITLTANARYNKSETGLLERIQDVFRPEYFRPFWSSDPYGVATTATLICWKTTQEHSYTFGFNYLQSALSTVPGFIWPNRPETPNDNFAKWFDESRGLVFAPGTGYAFNGIAESFMSFWYIGPALLGFACGMLCDRLTRVACQTTDFSGRALFAMATPIVLWTIPRNSVMVFFSPIMFLNYAVIFWILLNVSPNSSLVKKRLRLNLRAPLMAAPPQLSDSGNN